jgi:ABC-2 type transport system ATP-binding protein
VEYAVWAEGLRKRFGRQWALRGVDLAVPAGSVCGVLGPNGAGKTTAVRILTTLLRPDGGHATVAGYDVVRQGGKVRASIGLAGQHAAVDDMLTGRGNLEMFGRLYHRPAAEARRRAVELLDRFDLTEAADRMVKGYSGGMRRRLDLAASLIIRPRVVFLDEPTTGLDPRSRNAMWAEIRALAAAGTTVLLTTQYLEEADQLADRVAVIHQGAVIAEGTPDTLKKAAGGERVSVTVARAGDLVAAQAALARAAGAEPVVEADDRMVTVPVTTGAAALAGIVRELDAAGVAAEDITLRRPTLDEAFLQLTEESA